MSAVAQESLLAAALAGDEDAFRALTAPHTRELHVHCYRMLGSLHDAEDALQETLLRAWRHIATFEARSSFRAWLYRIATNACLRAAAQRKQPTMDSHPYPTTPETIERLALTPYPDVWLDELASSEPTPAARYELHESVQLAFLAAIQLLPPRQRAVLILRDVLGWSAVEVAGLLDTTTASVNSALQRARATLDERRLLLRATPSDEVERSLLRRYVEAWEKVDIEALVALLQEDARMTMPPQPMLFRGRRAIGDFFATVPAGGALDVFRLVPTRANRRPALAAYGPDPGDGVYRPYGMMVFEIQDEAIAEITGFADPSIFPAFGLAKELPG
jgi:RNA polymerase sigma-70 factor (ECF subfamily)